jgi:hypothetical protein
VGAYFFRVVTYAHALTPTLKLHNLPVRFYERALCHQLHSMGQPLRLYLPANAFTSRHAPLYETHDVGLLSQCLPIKKAAVQKSWSGRRSTKQERMKLSKQAVERLNVCAERVQVVREKAQEVARRNARKEAGRGEWDAR